MGNSCASCCGTKEGELETGSYSLAGETKKTKEASKMQARGNATAPADGQFSEMNGTGVFDQGALEINN
jgi:hypothetical protein